MSEVLEFPKAEPPEVVTRFHDVVEAFKDQSTHSEPEGTGTRHVIKTASLYEREGELTSDAIIKGVGHVKYSMDEGRADINENMLGLMEKRLGIGILEEAPPQASDDGISP